MSKLSDNVHREPSKAVKLACGHMTVSAPIVIWPKGRNSYQCPKGCGLVRGGRAR